MSFNLVVTAQPSDRDKAAASAAMVAIQGSIPYGRVLGCVEEVIAIPYSRVLGYVEEAIAIAREEGYRAGWHDGFKDASATVADSDAPESC